MQFVLNKKIQIKGKGIKISYLKTTVISSWHNFAESGPINIILHFSLSWHWLEIVIEIREVRIHRLSLFLYEKMRRLSPGMRNLVYF